MPVVLREKLPYTPALLTFRLWVLGCLSEDTLHDGSKHTLGANMFSEPDCHIYDTLRQLSGKASLEVLVG